MTDKELHKLNRRELIKLLLMEVQEVESLQGESDVQEEKIEMQSEMLGRLKLKLDEKDEQIGHLKRKLDGKDVQLQRLSARLDEKDLQIDSLKKRLDERDELISFLRKLKWDESIKH